MSVWERTWKINDATHGLAKGGFALEKHGSDGFVYYTMNDIVCEKFAAEAWADCRLVRRGRFLQPWAPQTPLDPFSDANKAKYTVEMNKWLDKVTSATLRLEGDLDLAIDPAQSGLTPPDVSVSTQSVTLLVASDAVKEDDGTLRDLMIVRVRSRIGQTGLVGAPDGTGTGDPKK